jgi:hypothetical protein
MADIKEEPVNTQPTVRAFVVHQSSLTLNHVVMPSQGTAPMSAGGSKNALNRPIGPDGKRNWSYGLFDCFSACGLCTRNRRFLSHAFADSNSFIPLPTLQAASPLGALASSTVGTGNTSAVYKPKAPCSLLVANRWTINAVSTVGW